MKTVMTIDQYKRYMNGELTLRQVRREHNSNSIAMKIIANKNLIGIVGLELMFVIQVVVLIFMSNSNELNDITVSLLRQFSDTDVKELMKSYIEIARV